MNRTGSVNSGAPGADAGETLKIGFVGAPTTAKGWDVFLRLSQRRALDLDQHVDRHGLRVFRQVGQLDQQAGAIIQ